MVTLPNPNNVRTTEQLIEAWNSHDVDCIAGFFHPGFTNRQSPFAPVVGLDAYLKHCEAWFTAFPDFQIEAVALFGAGDLVCLESVATGTRVRGWFGADPSNRRETVAACDVLVFENGRILEERGYWDYSVVTGLPAPNAVPVA